MNNLLYGAAVGTHRRRAEKVYLPMRSPLTDVANHHFPQKFRFNKTGFRKLMSVLHPVMSRSHSATVMSTFEQQIAVTLNILSKNSMQFDAGYDAGFSQSTTSRCFNRVIDSLVEVSPDWITWPRGLEKSLLEDHYLEKYGLPGIVGAIDGTMCQIIRPTELECDYVCRNNYHALNAGIVADHETRIRWVSTHFPGSAHDSRVFSTSMLHAKLSNGEYQGVLLADSAYRAERFTLTPIRTPRTASELAYNKAHRAARATVEQAIGALKRQWHILHAEMRYSPEVSSKVIVACCVLRNMYIEWNSHDVFRLPAIVDSDDDDAPSPIDSENESDDEQEDSVDGLEFRDNLIRNFF